MKGASEAIQGSQENFERLMDNANIPEVPAMPSMKIPEIPSAYSPQNGIKGLITVDYLSALLTLRPDTAHINSDTLRWAIYIKDKAGHQSNTILTDSLYLFK